MKKTLRNLFTKLRRFIARKPIQLKLPLVLMAALAIVLAGCSGGCKSGQLEPGGAYAPTNEAGQVIYTDTGLALADASYKLAYETILSVLKFERENRIALWEISPDIKHGLDSARPLIVDIDLRWATARRAYKANPTPEGLTPLQTILSEINRLVPVVQQQVSGISQDIKTKQLRKD